MPKRYAYNTSATQIKKRYAMIGSTATQIKKKYAMIGSTATLVYSADGNIFPDMAWTGGGANAGIVTTSSLQVILPTGSGKTNSKCYTSSKVDLTNYSKLIFVVSQYAFNDDGTPQMSVGIDSDTTTHTHASFDKYLAVTGTGTYTLDVSSITGSYYIAIAVWYPSDKNNGFTVTSITAE